MSIQACTEWATESYQECAEWEDQGYQGCDDWEDQGYSACDEWDDNCCDWWPCSWACAIITWVCVATVWISNWVCVAWVWISNVVCVLWTTVVTVICVAWEIIVILATPIVVLLELILAIPIVGRLIAEFLNLVRTIIVRLAQLPDLILTVIGIRPLKKIRLCIIILRDENGVAVTTEANLQAAITSATDIFRDEANVHIVVEGIHTVDAPSPTYALDVGCNLAAWGEDLTLAGSYFQATAAWQCPTGGLGRVTGFSNPMVAFCVRDIPGGTLGCALGPLNDYLTIEGGNPVCLAHEMGHKVGLWHCCTGVNLASGTCGGTLLQWWQVAIVRNSKYVSYI